MDHRFQPQRSRYRAGGGLARKEIGSSDLNPVSMGRAHVEGNGQGRKRTNGPKIGSHSTCGEGSRIEEDSFALESRRSSSKKASRTPIKRLMDEEMSKETESRLPSPSVIARLMGLDALPPTQVAHKQQKEMGSCLQKTSSARFQGKYASDEDHSLRKSSSEYQEFKDVFEVKDSLKVEKHKNRQVHKGMPCVKRDENDVAFIRQKFMEAKRLSTDESLQDSKEFKDALEVLDSNKDLFLKFLQEPNSLFTKHLHDLKCFQPSPHESHITILKSSKGKKYEIDEASCKSEGKSERLSHMQKDVISSFRKPSLANHSLKEHSGSLPHKLLRSRSAGKTETIFHPTRIVVLKPSLEKAQNMARNVTLPRSHENDQFGYRRHGEFRQSGIQQGRDRQKLFDNVEVMGHKEKGSREIAREITKQLKRSVSSGSDKISVSKFNRYIKDESSCAMSGVYNLNNSKAYQRTPGNFDYWNSSYSPSSSYSTESSVSREARKRLSDQWRITQRFQEARVVGRGSGTLGEMLTVSDRETPRETLDSFIMQNIPDEKLARDVLGTHCCPSGISSRDGWKDGCSINLPRSSSLPASSTVYGTPKSSIRQRVGGSDSCYMLKDVLNLGADDSLHGNLNQRRSSSHRSFKFRIYNPNSINFGGEENKLPGREIHVNPEELRNRIHVTDLSGVKPMLSNLSDSNIANSGNLVDNCLVPESMDAEMPFITNERQVQQPVQNGEFSGNNHIDKVLEEMSPDHPQLDSYPSECDRIESEPLVSSKEAEQPSPVSVLEPPSEEDKSSPECFERVSADLQELRMQLQLLRLGSSDTYAEESEAFVSSEDDNGDCNSPLKKGEILQAFRNEEDRDFSYLLDILIDSGVHCSKQDRVLDACYSPEHSVDSSVFEKLEKKYGVLVDWSKSERKLLFDLISSIVPEILTPFLDLHPSWKPKRRLGPIWGRERLVEGAWQIVVSQRKELIGGNPEEKILDPRWLDLGDDVEMIGREIEGMLNDDLLEELVSEFILV